MGHAASHSVKKELGAVRSRSETRVGTIAVTGRYHKAPIEINMKYKMSDKVLGSGYNGAVHVATAVEDANKTFAVKPFKLHGVGADKKEELETECEVFLGLDHPHVVRLVDVYESEEYLWLVMENMKGGELFRRVTKKKRFDEKTAAETCWQMLLAVKYLHAEGIVHRDLKLENFLYETVDGDHLKLIDFGFSKIWNPSTKMQLSCGTLAYVAPEVLGKSYTSQCDMWSLGVIVYILLFGMMPFQGAEAQQLSKIKSGQYIFKKDVWDRVSENAQDFVKKLLVKMPDNRMNAEQAIAHPWLKDRGAIQTSPADRESISKALENFGHGSKLRRTAMTMMAWSLTSEERAQVRKAFLEIDTDRTGAINLAEFTKLMEENFKWDDNGGSEEDHQAIIKEAFRALDSNTDEVIHYSEFLAAMGNWRIALHKDLLVQTFERFDTERTGLLTVDNFKHVLGNTMSDEEIQGLINEADADGSGAIDVKEFVRYLTEAPAPQEHHLEAAHGVIDHALKQGHVPAAKPKPHNHNGVLIRMASNIGAHTPGRKKATAGGDPPDAGKTQQTGTVAPASAGGPEQEAATPCKKGKQPGCGCAVM